jgi:hypothetical protein
MVERIFNDEERRLADRLKREAQATRPAFSEALHVRICEALKQCEAPVRQGIVTWWLRTGWWPVAIAATLLVSVSLVAWWLGRPPGPEARSREVVTIPIESPDPVADPGMITGPTARTAEHVGMLVDSTVSAGQWAYLDHDARVAFRLLMDQLALDVASME